MNRIIPKLCKDCWLKISQINQGNNLKEIPITMILAEQEGGGKEEDTKKHNSGIHTCYMIYNNPEKSQN